MKILVSRGMAGLGALGPYPPNSMLKPGFMWYRYMVPNQYGQPSTTLQMNKCPGDAPWGCTIWEGYAWGQTPTTGEFQDVPTRASTTTTAAPAPLTAAQITEKCQAAYAGWARTHPTLAGCLTSADKAAYASLCGALWRNQLDLATATARWDARVRDRCLEKCRDGWDAWRRRHPAKARCLPTNARAKFVDLCMQALYGQISGVTRDQLWNKYVARKCEEVARRPDDGGGSGGGPAAPDDAPGDGSGLDTPTPTRPVIEDTPDVVEASDGPPPGSGVVRGDELVDSIVHDNGLPDGGNGDANGAGEEKSLLRRIGPIVGIGLLLAVGGVSWWQYQKKKKGRR
jgi:hypothetical protein